MSNNTIIILGLLAAVFLIGGVGVGAYKRIKNASKPGGVGDAFSRLKEELESYDGGKDPVKDDAGDSPKP